MMSLEVFLKELGKQSSEESLERSKEEILQQPLEELLKKYNRVMPEGILKNSRIKCFVNFLQEF